MHWKPSPEEERVAGELADAAAAGLDLDAEDQALLATILEIDLLVHPTLDGVLQTEVRARSHVGPSGTVSREDQQAPAVSGSGSRRR
jgi:hypothetical protein